MLTLRATRPFAVLAAALPLALSACGDESATVGTPPPVLHLADASAAALADARTPGGVAGSGLWKLAGALPAGSPGPRPVYDVDGATLDRDNLAALATALHVGPVRRTGDAWVARSGDRTLIVSAGGRWTYGAIACDDATIARDAGECPVSSGTVTATSGVGVSTAAPDQGPARHVRDLPCRQGQPCTVPLPTPPPPATVPQTRAVAAPVLTAVGLTDARFSPGFVIASQSVGGQDAVGYTTTVSVDPDGTVSGGSGWLGAPDRGAAYPLVSARTAYDALVAMPVPMMELACPVTAKGPPACPGAGTRVVTGARLGLTLTYRDDGRALLVPAWLFTVRGSDEPVAQIAVAPRYLGDPRPPSDVPGVGVGSSDPGAGGGVIGGSPGKPGTVEPTGPTQPTLSENTMQPSSYRTEDGGRTLVLQVADGICVPARYDAAAKEAPDVVTVSVTKVVTGTPDPDRACPEIARIFDVPVTLEAPLGGRSVQTADGTEIPRQ